MSETATETAPGYQVLARRYRSRTFGEVVGQESIAETLERAIERDRTAHAYLFCGTRGVGKTSMARIFARALNATDAEGEGQAVQDAILRGEDMDVVEIDGASNNGVQDARDLIANASIRPARSPFKIYIIDEVHMLSNAAFNALLKTMEEPPSHVKFILCTTEPHKVLPTIQSRCQRFDFRPISVPRIAAHLTDVLARESIEADEAVVLRVARLANGSMRDGLSILERIVAAADGRLDAELLERVLGVPPEDIVRDVVAAIGGGDLAGTLRAMATLLGEGLAPERALDGIAERFRLLLSAGVCGADPEILGTGSEEAAGLVEEAADFEPEQLVHMIALCDAASARVRVSASPRAILDAAVARMALSERFARAASLLAGDVAAVTPSKKKRLTGAESRPVAEPPVDRPVTKAAMRKTPPPPETAPPEVPSLETTPPTETPDPHSDVDAGSAGPWARLEAAATTPRFRAMIADFEFDRLEGDRLRLRRRDDASPGADWTVSHPESLERLASDALGRRIRIEFAGAASSSAAPSPVVGDDVESHPLVAEAMELFDAHVVQVRTIDGSSKVEEPAAKPEKEE
jgi:DNA polymerase-3 subunit gamma/tau